MSLMSVFIGLSLPIHILSMGLVGTYAVWGLLNHFKNLFIHPVTKLLGGFALISLIYYVFGHSTDFNIMSVSAGYTDTFETELGNFDAKFIVMFTAVGMFLAYTCGLLLFEPKERPAKAVSHDKTLQYYFSWISIILVLIGIMYLLDFVLTIEGAGMGLYLPVYICLLITFREWLPELPDIKLFNLSAKKVLPTLYNVIIVLVLLTIPVVANKTILIGIVAVFVVYFSLIYTYKLKFDLPRQIYNRMTGSLSGKLSIIAFLVGAVIAFFALGINAVIDERIDYFVGGISSGAKGGGTIGIRVDNLNLLLRQWNENQDAFNTVFGHGLAKSRESMLYLSAQMRYTTGRLVQTTHNSYIEFLYDYGLMSFLYFGSYIVLFYNYFTTLRDEKSYTISRYMGASGIALILFVSLYGLTDGIKVPFQIAQFGIHGFITGFIHYFKQKGLINSKNN